MKVQEPTPQHFLAKAMEQSYWMMFLAIAMKQSSPHVIMSPPPQIAPMKRMLVSDVIVSDNYNRSGSYCV